MRVISLEGADTVQTESENLDWPSSWKARSHQPASAQGANIKIKSNEQTPQIVCFLTILPALLRIFVLNDAAGYYPAICHLSLFFYVKNTRG